MRKVWLRHACWVSALAVLGSLACFAQAAAGAGPCNQAAPEPILHVALPGRPFSAIPTRDGCWVFVPVIGDPGSPRGVAVLRRAGGKVAVERLVPTEGSPLGAVLTHDGKLLIVASGTRLAFLDAGRLISGQPDAVLGYLRYGPDPVSIYVNVTADGRFLFVSDEAANTITVINLEKARSSGFNPDSVVGKIPAGIAPIALTFSPDGRYLYTTSQLALPGYGWPAECKPEGKVPAEAGAKAVNPQGAILVVDVAKAQSDPANAVIAKAPAGCSAVRLALSPKGDRAYVTARNSNALLVFDTGKLIGDPEHALIGKVPVGTAPVGVTVVDEGRKVVVANSNRFFAGPNDKSDLTVIDATSSSWEAAAVLGTIPTGAFPRELQVTADGQTLLVSNFASRTLELVDLRRLPLGRSTKAVVTRPVANMNSAASVDTDVVSQAILGTNVEVLEEKGGWAKIRTPDDYTGWTELAALKAVEKPYAAAARAVQVESLFAHLYRTASVTKLAPLMTAPYEARLEVVAEPPENEQRWIQVRLPDDRAAWVQRGDVTFEPKTMTVPEMIAHARRFLGLPYTWGGTSSFGYDCSGFMQMLGRRLGVTMPRDADPQSKWDRLKPVEKADLQPGDLLYFGSAKRITHTGMYIGGGEFINFTTYQRPMGRVDRLDEDHWTRLFVCARRLK